MNKKGILIVVSGFAGSGKGTLTKELIRRYDSYTLSISATTRGIRPGEKHGEHYFFISREEFERMIENGELLEYAEYVGNYYGTPRPFVEKMLNDGRDVILEIEYLGAFKVKQKFPDAVLIFLTPPSAGEVYSRLKKRGTEDSETIKKRILRAREESGIMEKYDYIVVNDDLEESIISLHNTIQSAKNLVALNGQLICGLQTEFDELLKNI